MNPQEIVTEVKSTVRKITALLGQESVDPDIGFTSLVLLCVATAKRQGGDIESFVQAIRMTWGGESGDAIETTVSSVPAGRN